MTGSIFKRKLQAGVSWGYVFFGGWDEHGKRIQVFKSGFETKDAASKAVRAAIEKYEAANGKVSREIGSLGRRVWAFTLGDVHQTGYSSKREAETALRVAVRQREAERAAEKLRRVEEATEKAGPVFAHYFAHWLTEHASRRCAPKTLERYRDLGQYLIRELGEVRLNEMTTAKIQVAIHHLKDHGGRKTEAEPNGRPLAAKTVRHMGTLLYTVLSDADRLGVLKIPHPMANRRVLLPKLSKRKPSVLDEAKLRLLFERARNTRLHPFLVLAAATGCRRGELLALQWTDIDLETGLLSVSKSLEQTQSRPPNQKYKIRRAARVRRARVGNRNHQEAPERSRPGPGDVWLEVQRQQLGLLPAGRQLLFTGPSRSQSRRINEEGGATGF